ncbi:MAG: hypothetical protein GXY15_12010 [Candidatus Hydrogenedentes bacterium]|nr:hypothetical protein [Candidatus Hydrogenedentota bacterium]
MVRGLRIRQIFICVDLLLTALFLGVAALVAHEMSRPPQSVEALLPPDEGGAAPVAPLAHVSDREFYDGVAGGGLFGEAGRWDPGAVPEEAPVVEEVAPADDISETTLSLRLIGTVALSPKSPFAVAFIGEKEGNDPGKSYFIGEEVADSVALDEVFPREVILLNRATTPPQRERLRMDEEEEESGAGPSAPPAAAPAPETVAEPSERITLKRDEMIAEVAENYASLVNIRPELATDENGNVLGITAAGIGEFPLAQRLGVQENDILQTVNNEKLDSEDKIMEMVQKYQTATSLRIGILRDGKPKVITYRLE